MRNAPSPHVPLLSSDRMSGFTETPPSGGGGCQHADCEAEKTRGRNAEQL